MSWSSRAAPPRRPLLKPTSCRRGDAGSFAVQAKKRRHVREAFAERSALGASPPGRSAFTQTRSYSRALMQRWPGAAASTST